MDVSNVSTLVMLLVGYFVPLASAAIARQHWPEEVVGLITVGLSVLTALVAEITAHPSEFSFTQAGLHAALVWVVAYIARNQTWKTGPTGLSAKLLAFPQKLPPNGIQPGMEPAALTEKAAA